MICLFAASGASADPANKYSGTSTPTHVKPTTSATFTVVLTTNPSSPEGADRAKIGIPLGFVVDAPSVQATTSAAGACGSSTWIADGELIADAKINLTRPGTTPGDELCPGATLSVVFTATSAGGDGSYTWATELLRGATPFALAGAQPTVQVDGTAPQVSIGSSPSDPSNQGSPSFGFTADEAATFECRLDDEAFASCASPKGYAGLADGSHTFRVKATDAAGNTSGEAVHTWTIDTVAPTVAITEKPTNPSTTKQASFTFSANEPSVLECKLDGGAFAACTSPQHYAGLSEGSHTFSVRATDAAGNTGGVAGFSWAVDTVAPSVTLTSKPSDPSKTSFPSFSFVASEGGTTFQCRIDSGAFTACSSPKSYSNLAEATHTFVVRATDAAGNTGPETTYEWTIDTTPPTASITSGPTNPSNERSPTFEFGADESSTFSCKLDTGAFAPCTSPKNYGVNFADGAHSFVVRPTDLAGNVGASVSLAWTIDTTGPIATITQRPATTTNDNTPAFVFTSADASGFQCSLDGAAFAACVSPVSYPSLADGQHSFGVRATDSLGNTGLATVVEWTIDTVAPTATITQKPASPSNDSSATFRFAANETGSTFTCRLEEGGFSPCTSPKTYTGLTDGGHKFTVRARDAAGNTGPGVEYLWTIVTFAPTTTIDQKPSALTNLSSAVFTFSAPPGTSFSCKLDAGVFQACSSPKSYPSLADGQHTFTVRATDAAGNTGADAVHSWTIDTVAPVAVIADQPSNPSNNRAPTFSFSAAEANGFLCSLDGGTLAPCSSPRAYGDLLDGAHAFTVRATDAAGNIGPEATAAWTIKTLAAAAALTSAPAGLSNSRVATFAFTAGEPSSFDCKLDDRAFAPCGSPVTYHGLSDSSHTFSVRARDLLGNLSAQVEHSWRIDTVAPQTAIGAKPRAGTTSRSATFRFSSTERGTFECRLDGAPFALCVSPKSYSRLSRATHRFQVRAIDAAGNSDATPSAYGWRIAAPVARKAASALLSPHAEARVTRPPLLVWHSVNRARYYNIQLYRGRRKVLTAWPTRARLQLQARWRYLGRTERLVAGSYRWYVWPGYGPPSARNYGRMLGQSTFVVARRSGR